ncbi:MAG: transglycosylase domain-containing protein [Bacillota bacterium]
MSKYIKLFMLFLVIVLILEFSAIYIYSYYVVSQPEEPPALESNSFVYDRHGNITGELYGKVNRVPVPLEQIPVHVRNAFVAVEDERFYLHSGVDLKAILRAFYGNLRQGEIVQGGSTITQQVIKIYYLTSEKTYVRKIREAIMALQFEYSHDKSQILALYLNGIYLGEGTYGVQAASKYYFNKDVKDLTLSEAATLAGMARAPGHYNPYTHPRGVKGRRGVILDKMVAQGYADWKAAEEARQAPLELRDRNKNDKKAGESYYIDHVVDEAIRLVGKEAVFGGGLRIRTAYDPYVQSLVDSALAGEYFQDDRIQNALVLLDSEKGEIISMSGGRSYGATRGFNRATQMKRQPGSTLKPVAVYGPAFELGYRQDSMVEDMPRSWGGYSPRNYDDDFWGSITLERALQWSRNLPAVWLLDRIGIDPGYSFALKLGIKLDERDRHLALALGGLTRGVTPLEMAGAYACFANGGYYNPPRAITLIEDSSGKVVYRPPQPVPVMKPDTASMMTDALKSVVRGGIGTEAAVAGYEVAGKTGTTELPDSGQYKGIRGNKDAWFVGYVGRYTCAVWVGYDEKDMDLDHYLKTWGGTRAAQIFGRVMGRVILSGL